jgi:hypothetical protein
MWLPHSLFLNNNALVNINCFSELLAVNERNCVQLLHERRSEWQAGESESGAGE